MSAPNSMRRSIAGMEFFMNAFSRYRPQAVLVIPICAGLAEKATWLDTRKLHGPVAQSSISDDIRQVYKRAAFDGISEGFQVRSLDESQPWSGRIRCAPAMTRVM